VKYSKLNVIILPISEKKFAYKGEFR